MIGLFEGIQELVALKNVTFRFNCNNQITDGGVYKIKNNFVNLQALEKLVLDFTSCIYVSINSSQVLNHVLSKLPALKDSKIHIKSSFLG